VARTNILSLVGPSIGPNREHGSQSGEPQAVAVRPRTTRRHTKTQTSSPRTSHRNRCTASPRMVVQRPSESLNRQRCRGQTTSPSSTQPWPSEPPEWGQRPERATTSAPVLKTASRKPSASSDRPAPSLSSSSRQTATHCGMQSHPSHRDGNLLKGNLGLASEASHSVDSRLTTCMLQSRLAARGSVH
jgi:hypothetical protein